MMGLMVKDLRILKNQFKFYITILAVALFITIINDNPFFVVSYVTMIFGFFAITAISYDEVDNGYSFLFTMPIRRHEYVLQKYAFACITTMCAGLVSYLILMIGLIKNGGIREWKEYGFMTVCFVFAVLIYVMVMLPVQLKFGIEKSRMVIIAAMIVLGVAIIAITRAVEEIPELGQMLEKIKHIGNAGMLGIAAVLWLVVTSVSYMISVHVMERKDF